MPEDGSLTIDNASVQRLMDYGLLHFTDSGWIVGTWDDAVAATSRASLQGELQEPSEANEFRQKLRMIISHASGGHLSEPGDVDRSINDICVQISAHKNEIWKHAQEAALRTAAPQVNEAWREIETLSEREFVDGFANSRWYLVATSDRRVTEAMPYIGEGGVRLWTCSRGSNCSDPRWPAQYLRPTVTHYRPLPEPPAAPQDYCGIEEGNEEDAGDDRT